MSEEKNETADKETAVSKPKVAKKTVTKEKPSTTKDKKSKAKKEASTEPIDATNIPDSKSTTVIKAHAKPDELLKKYKYRRIKIEDGSTIEIDTEKQLKEVAAVYLKKYNIDIIQIYEKQTAPSALNVALSDKPEEQQKQDVSESTESTGSTQNESVKIEESAKS